MQPHTEHDHHDDDNHAHDHEAHSHDDSRWSRWTHAVSDLLGGHSHDAADQVDEALEADAAGRRALLISLAGLAVTAAIQQLPRQGGGRAGFFGCVPSRTGRAAPAWSPCRRAGADGV